MELAQAEGGAVEAVAEDRHDLGHCVPDRHVHDHLLAEEAELEQGPEQEIRRRDRGHGCRRPDLGTAVDRLDRGRDCHQMEEEAELAFEGQVDRP